MPQGPNVPYTNLSTQQVVQRSFDELNDRIRVDAEVSATIGAIECVITDIDDSIKIGNGSGSYAAVTGGELHVRDDDVLIKLADIENQLTGVTTPTISNQTAFVADTEYSYSFPLNTKRFQLKARGNAKLQISYTSGQTNTNFITLSPGSIHKEKNLEINNFTIYYRSNKIGEIIEILSWV